MDQQTTKLRKLNSLNYASECLKLVDTRRFAFRDSVGNDLIQINPLGLAISYFREDEALH